MGGKRLGLGPVPDFSAYRDLVTILFGMRVPAVPPAKTLRSFKAPIERGGSRKPAGLLYADDKIVFSVIPLHIGMRWYWRDPGALAAWLDSEQHEAWWSKFLDDTRGTDLWHEVHYLRLGTDPVVSGKGIVPDVAGLAARSMRSPLRQHSRTQQLQASASA